MAASVQLFPMFRGIDEEALMPLVAYGFGTPVAQVTDPFALPRQLRLR